VAWRGYGAPVIGGTPATRFYLRRRAPNSSINASSDAWHDQMPYQARKGGKPTVFRNLLYEVKASVFQTLPCMPPSLNVCSFGVAGCWLLVASPQKFSPCLILFCCAKDREYKWELLYPQPEHQPFMECCLYASTGVHADIHLRANGEVPKTLSTLEQSKQNSRTHACHLPAPDIFTSPSSAVVCYQTELLYIAGYLGRWFRSSGTRIRQTCAHEAFFRPPPLLQSIVRHPQYDIST
jgi:hypothetical protein